jgi:hypothetical protein
VEIFLTFFYFTIILFLLWKWKFFSTSGISFKYLILLFGVKLVFSSLILYIYTYYYTDRNTADIFKFFDDASWLYENVFKESPKNYLKIIFGIENDSVEIFSNLKKTQYWFKPHETNVFNDNRTIIRLNALIYLISFGYYPIHMLLICFFSFLGLTAIFKTFLLYYPKDSRKIIVGVFLVPSVLFWGSGILKESILIFALGLFVYHFSLLVVKKKIYSTSLVMILFCLGLLAITKTYVLLTIIPSIIAWVISVFIKKYRFVYIFICTHLLLFFTAFTLSYVNKSFDFTGNLMYKQRDFINVARDTKAGSKLTIGLLDNSMYSYLKNTPSALLNSLFRPTFFEVSSWMSLSVSVENFALIVLFTLVLFFRKPPTGYQSLPILFALFFTLSLSLLIGWVVPVIGAIVRYKIPFMPFLITSLLLCIDFSKIREKRIRFK